MAISQWPMSERPRERLLDLGPKHLTDAELVAIFLRTGSVGLSAVDVARQLLSRFGSLHQLLAASAEDFLFAKRCGTSKICTVTSGQGIRFKASKSAAQRMHRSKHK